MARLWIRSIIAWSLWILAISGSVAASQPGCVLAGTRRQGGLQFLVAAEDGVSLVTSTGSVIQRFPGCLAVDADAQHRLVLCFEDHVRVLSEDGHALDVPLASLLPMLRLAGEPVRLQLSVGPLVVLPEQVPILMNPATGARRKVPDVVRVQEGRISFLGASHMIPVGKLVLMQEGRRLVALHLSDLKPAWSVPLGDRHFQDAKPVDGALDCLMDRGYHWRLAVPTGKRLSETRLDEDRGAMVVYDHGAGGPMTVRVTIRETGVLDALSAWKKGVMTAVVTVLRSGGQPVAREIPFSIERIGTFDAGLERFPDGVVLHLPDQDIVVHLKKGVPVIRSIPVKRHGMPVAGGVYTWDAVAGQPVKVN